MKTFSFGRCLGLGLGIGIASMALYGINNNQPSTFQPQQGEFRPLAGLVGENLPTPAVRPGSVASQTGFADIFDGDNQIQLSIIEELAPEDLTIDEILLEDSSSTANSHNDGETDLDATLNLVIVENADGTDGTEHAAGVSESVVLVEDSELDSGDISSREIQPTPQPSFNRPLVNTTNSQTENGLATAFGSPGVNDSKWKNNPFSHPNVHAAKTPKSFSPIPEKALSVTNDVLDSSELYETPESDEPSGATDFSVDEPELSNNAALPNVALPKPATDMPTTQLAQNFDSSSNVLQRSDPLESVSSSSQSSQSLGDPYAVTPLDLGVSDAVSQRAAHHIEYGKSLARRGAAFAARQEFYSALQVIAHANDGKTGALEHSTALRSAIMALKEAEDFVVTDAESQIGLSVARVIETHRSGILAKDEAIPMTPIQAMQRYFVSAQKQFAIAGGGNIVAAEALFCLGKLHSVMEQHEPGAGRLETAKAIVYHRAALNNDQNNFRSAGELGVLMARMGQLEDAKELFKQSLRIKAMPQAWENLAKIHQRLGETDLAQLAYSEQLHSFETVGATSIQWKPADRFNADAPMEFHDAIASKPAEFAKPIPPSGEQQDNQSFAQKLKNLF